MSRRSEKPLKLKVRVSHEATRLSTACVAAAFDLVVPILEQQTRPATAEPRRRSMAQTGRLAKPMRGD
jgi:hypothetical protein